MGKRRKTRGGTPQASVVRVYNADGELLRTEPAKKADIRTQTGAQFRTKRRRNAPRAKGRGRMS